MVKSATSLTGSGVKDFLWQRISARVLLFYTITLAYFICTMPSVDFAHWSALFSLSAMKVWTMVALIALLVHAWIGVWIIFTDYVHHRCVRGFLMALLLVATVVYLVWGAMILWS